MTLYSTIERSALSPSSRQQSGNPPVGRNRAAHLADVLSVVVRDKRLGCYPRLPTHDTPNKHACFRLVGLRTVENLERNNFGKVGASHPGTMAGRPLVPS